METFDENDENKLEYTPIYESYVKIMEDYIDAKMMEKYSMDEIKSFYLDFANDPAKYEAIDKAIVEELFAFTDFEQFKKQMLANKASINKDGKLTNENADVGNYNELADEKFCAGLYNEDPQDNATGWTKKTSIKDDAKGIDVTVYSKKCDGYPINWTRSVCKFKGVSVAAMDSLMKNVE